MVEAVDRLGQELKDGDRVVYPGRIREGRPQLEVGTVAERRDYMVRLLGRGGWTWARDVAKVERIAP